MTMMTMTTMMMMMMQEVSSIVETERNWVRVHCFAGGHFDPNCLTDTVDSVDLLTGWLRVNFAENFKAVERPYVLKLCQRRPQLVLSGGPTCS